MVLENKQKCKKWEIYPLNFYRMNDSLQTGRMT